MPAFFARHPLRECEDADQVDQDDDDIGEPEFHESLNSGSDSLFVREPGENPR